MTPPVPTRFHISTCKMRMPEMTESDLRRGRGAGQRERRWRDDDATSLSDALFSSCSAFREPCLPGSGTQRDVGDGCEFQRALRRGKVPSRRLFMVPISGLSAMVLSSQSVGSHEHHGTDSCAACMPVVLQWLLCVPAGERNIESSTRTRGAIRAR